VQTVYPNQIIQALQTIGIQTGDGLLVHSAVQFLGKPEGGIGMYLEAIQAVICPQGTLAVPAFNFAFAKSGQYDPQETPSVGMGAFSEYVRQHPQARRTTHPMQSVAVIGRYAGELARLDTPSAFDPGSAFERMLELDFKLLLLGAEVHAISCCITASAPTYPTAIGKTSAAKFVVWAHGVPRSRRLRAAYLGRTYRMFISDMQLDPICTSTRSTPVGERWQWHSTSTQLRQNRRLPMADFVAAADKLLADDPGHW
jgi:hypothetical protein